MWKIWTQFDSSSWYPEPQLMTGGYKPELPICSWKIPDFVLQTRKRWETRVWNLVSFYLILQVTVLSSWTPIMIILPLPVLSVDVVLWPFHWNLGSWVREGEKVRIILGMLAYLLFIESSDFSSHAYSVQFSIVHNQLTGGWLIFPSPCHERRKVPSWYINWRGCNSMLRGCNSMPRGCNSMLRFSGCSRC